MNRHLFLVITALVGMGCSAGAVVQSALPRKSVLRVGKAVLESERPFTPEEEDAIGRLVALELLSRFPPVADDSLQLYVNTVLQVIARASDRPVTYAGYTGGVLDTPTPNAFSTPGGYVFLTRGLLNRLDDEEELAAALAHEVAHVVLRHGLASIKRAQRARALGVLLSETARHQDRFAAYADAFGEMARAITVHILEKGWTRDQEWDADSLAYVYLSRAGYDPGGLIRLLERLQGTGETHDGTPSFLRTHPDLRARIQRLKGWNVSRVPADSLTKAREQRFNRYVHASGR